jgi:hypothetical protein
MRLSGRDNFVITSGSKMRIWVRSKLTDGKEYSVHWRYI